MADQMQFPDTIEEFMNKYTFQDVNEVYTNGSSLIPVFRVKQALIHYYGYGNKQNAKEGEDKNDNR